MTYTAVGSGFGTENASTVSLTTNGIGNFILCQVTNETASSLPTGLSSSNASWSALGTSFSGSTHAWTAQVFIGVVTAASTATLTATFSGGASSQTITGQEFSSTTGTPVLDVQGRIDSAGVTTWASLTPASSGELYFGFAVNGNNAISGSTSGYVYNASIDGHGNGQAYNLNCTGGVATAPVWGDSTEQFGIMVLVAPSGGGGGSAGPPVPPAQPGKTWLRRFKHRQQLPLAAPVSALTVNAPAAVADCTAQAAPVVQVSPLPGIPAASGADVATTSLAVLAGIPAATGAAPAPSILTGLVVNAGIPTATGTASQPVISISVLAGIPTATGAAPAPAIVAGTTVNAGIPTATGTAPSPVPAISVLPPAAIATGAAPQPVTAYSATAGIPTATGGAVAIAAISALAGLAAATGTAPQPVASISVKPGIPVATGAAPAPSILTGQVISAPAVTATGTASQPTSAATVFAGLAAATGLAPATSHGVTAGILAVTGTAAQPAIAAAVLPGVPAAAGVAGQAAAVSVLPFTVGVLTASDGATAALTATTAGAT